MTHQPSFRHRLAEGVANIAAAFYPKPVVVRLSDFKTNEYARLLGGRDFEPEEPNPMLGFRGAARYAHPAYEDGFALECAAMRRVRDRHGAQQRQADDPVLPPCRRGDAACSIAWPARARSAALNGLEVYVMCEIPNNVHPHRRVRRAVRRLLHRLQRPDPAHPRASTATRSSSLSTSTNATRAC
jgi:pyruvate, water dikinase